MANVKKKKKTIADRPMGTLDPNMKSFANDPYFLKKAEKAKELLRKYPLPEGVPPFEG
jgi:hypothetical protein